MNQLTKLAACFAISFGAAGFTSASVAASASATFKVTASIIESCTVASLPLSSRNYHNISGARLDELVLTSPACPLVATHAITLDAGNGIGSTQPIPLQGRVPVEQNAMAGSYVDTLTVMLTY